MSNIEVHSLACEFSRYLPPRPQEASFIMKLPQGIREAGYQHLCTHLMPLHIPGHLTYHSHFTDRNSVTMNDPGPWPHARVETEVGWGGGDTADPLPVLTQSASFLEHSSIPVPQLLLGFCSPSKSNQRCRHFHPITPTL